MFISAFKETTILRRGKIVFYKKTILRSVSKTPTCYETMTAPKKIMLFLVDVKNFASQRLVSEEENEPFLLENVSNLTYKFCKIVIQKLICQIWCIFKEKWLIFSSKTRRWEVKVLTIIEVVKAKYYWIKQNNRICALKKSWL